MAKYSTSKVGGSMVEGVGATLKALRQARDKYGRYASKPEVSVVYGGTNIPYAIIVHEDLEMNHPNGGQAKYLEQPLRENKKRMADIIRSRMGRKRKPMSLQDAMKEACNLLLEKSRPLVPVDTGRLRDSGKVVIKGG